VNDPEDDPVPIRPGEYKTGYIAEGDLDGYTFYANAGDFVTILMGEVNDPTGNFRPQVELIEPDGSRTWRASGVFSATIDVQKIEQSGMCTIIARELLGVGTAMYALNMIRVQAAGTPIVHSLVDDPDPVYSTGTLTLTALGVSDPDGTVVQVDFYRDLNSNGYLDLHGPDQLLGSDIDGQDGWIWSGSIGDSAPFGLNTYFARAQDNVGLWSDPASTTGQIRISIPGDINQDGLVNCSDMEILIANLGTSGCSEPSWCSGADLDRNGVVDMADLAILVDHWGQTSK
jgi:hypothetical protein